mmetsp:Transcript_69051/g.200351  ORF Transcript_69051/g.200351 Transcript_69051/m.200351 type:complete len:200 (+) Transcript_69051:333-932(+)
MAHFDVLDEALRPRDCFADLPELLTQTRALDHQQPALHLRPEEGVGEAHEERQGCGKQQSVHAHLAPSVRPDDCPQEEARPHGRQDKQFPGVDGNLGALQDVQPGATDAPPEQHHGEATRGGADVRERPGDVRRPDDGAEMRSAHGVLQAASAGSEAGREHAVAAEVVLDDRGEQKQGVADEGGPIQRLASDVDVVFVN